MKTWQKLHQNKDLWERYFIREKVLTAIRKFFLDRNFHEVEVPLLVPNLPPESCLEVFETTLFTRNRKPLRAFLPTSPEPFIKKLLVAGIGDCFSITKSFRNTEGQSSVHNPEFTILEWYRTHADYTDIMKDCEELLQFIYTYLLRSRKKTDAGSDTQILAYQGKKVRLTPPWERISVREAFKKYANIDLEKVLDRDSLASIAEKREYQITSSSLWEELFHQIYLIEIEPHLGRGHPTIIYDYPIQLAALSRKKEDNPLFAERFEFFIEGLELGDAYSELTDWKEQLERFKTEREERRKMGKIDHPTDMDFIEALRVGMPKAGGIAVGVDRLIMLFADVKDIADTMFFPGKELFPELYPDR